MKTIIFDFDGVLADTFDTVLALVHEQGHQYGVHVRNVRALRNLPLQQVLKELKVPLYKVPFLAKKVKTELNKKIRTVNTFTGIKPALRKLKAHARLGIVSSNSRASISAFLKKHNMQQYFDFVFTDTPVFSKTRMLKRVLKKQKLKKQDTVYVGDQLLDIKAAQKAGIAAAAVGWGYNAPAALKKAKPAFFIRKPSELTALRA